MIIVGIDPGKKGAIVAVNTANDQGYYLPLAYSLDGLLEWDPIKSLFDKLKPERVYLEKSQGRGGAGPGTKKKGAAGWSATGTHNQGEYYGQIRFAVGRVLGSPFSLVDPQRWQAIAHEGIKKDGLTAKQRSLIAYKNLFPVPAIPSGPKGGKPGDGIIDALLITVYGIEKNGKSIRPWRLVKWGT